MRLVIWTLFLLTLVAAPALAYVGMAYDTVCADGVLYDDWGYLDYAVHATMPLLAFVLGVMFARAS